MSRANSTTVSQPVQYPFPEGSHPIPGAPGYRICENGTIYSGLTLKGKLGAPWHVIKPVRNKRNGRLHVALRVNHKSWQVCVHTLVLLTFVGPCPPGMLACHDPDPDPANCNLWNLRWDTQKNNQADMIRHGRVANGERQGASKMKAADIPEVFRLHKSGMTYKGIGRKYGVSGTTIRCIILRKTWGHIPVSAEYLPHRPE